MFRRPEVLPLDGVSFETAVSAMSADRGFIATDARRMAGVGPGFSIVASNPSHKFSFSGAFVTIDGHTVIDNPMDSLSRFLALADDLPHDPYLPFSGGSLGYVSFEGVRALGGFEPAKGFSRYPQCSFGIYESSAIFNHTEGTALVVSCHRDPGAASRDAHILKEHLENAPRWISRAEPDCMAGTSFLGHRFLPPDVEFMRQLDSAHTWLRSEKLSRMHITRQVTTPSCGTNPIGRFLTGGQEGSRRAIFSHDDSYAIVSLGAGGFVKHDNGNWSQCLKESMSSMERERFAGTPLDKAMAFIHENEVTPRIFYGGSFGMFGRDRAQWSEIESSVTFADGAMAITSGADMTLDNYPPHFATELLSKFISA